MGVLAPQEPPNQASSRTPLARLEPLDLASSWPGLEPWLLLCGLSSPVCEAGSFCG